MSAAESLSLGVPVVGGAVGGLLEVVGHEQGGLLAANSRELLNFINILIDQPAYAASLGQGGRRRVKQFYSKEVALGRWKSFLKNEPLLGFTPHHQGLRPKDFLVRSCIRRVFPLPVIDGIRRASRGFRQQMRSA